MSPNKDTRVLILDDEPIVGERLKASLERIGFTVEALFTSADALRRLGEERFDILVTDLKMSGTDGLEVLRTAKRLHPAIKPVVITGFATRDTADEAMRSGALAFVAKPFKISYLKELLLELAESPADPSG